MSSPETAPDERPGARAASTVFNGPRRGSFWISVGAHVAVFGLLIAGVVTGVIGRTVQTIIQIAEFDVARRPRTRTPPPPPPPAPAPPQAAQPQAPRHAERRAAAPARGAHTTSGANAPHLLTAGSGDGPGGFSMASGDNNDWRGGPTGAPPVEPPRPVPAPPPVAPPVREPATARRPGPAEQVVDEDALSQRPEIRCDADAIAALYPQAALDNEVEADVPVEVVISAEGAIVSAHARTEPGFGLARVAERAVLTTCRVAAVARDRAGAEIAARVVHHIRFALD